MAKTELATPAQVKYLTTLAEKVGKERFDAEFAKVVKGSDIEPRTPRQRCATAAKRLTKARARKLRTSPELPYTVEHMTTHGEAAAAHTAIDEDEAGQRALATQMPWDDPEQRPGEPCPCGDADHVEECDCEEGAFMIHVMRIPGSLDELTLWEDHFECTHGSSSYTQKLTLHETPWGVREQAVDRRGASYERVRLFPGITHGQESLLPGFGVS
ncbi:hypothetical protein ACIBBE_23885 [Streptomyces sp. NPDC051644]|uniref:hypothetical protein n=1 Tax=Streptomyces sp. NPDC051644 TaxID=3365666 RepID=UPI00379EE9B1